MFCAVNMFCTAIFMMFLTFICFNNDFSKIGGQDIIHRGPWKNVEDFIQPECVTVHCLSPITLFTV